MKKNVEVKRSPSLLHLFKHLIMTHSDKYISHGDSVFIFLYVREINILSNNTYYVRSTWLFSKIPLQFLKIVGESCDVDL